MRSSRRQRPSCWPTSPEPARTSRCRSLPRAPSSSAPSGIDLRTIPRGATTTYGQIAHALGRPRAAQAVGAAVGANPLSIVVPCHRVVGSTGAMTGYAGGIERKQALLLLEGAPLA